jgi:hypothetical protein
MNIVEAIKLMKEGEKVRCGDMCVYWIEKSENMYGGVYYKPWCSDDEESWRWEIEIEDIESDEWEVV